MARNWGDLEITLSDIEFLEAKIHARLSYELLQDIDQEGVIQAVPQLAIVRRSLAAIFQGICERPHFALNMLWNQFRWAVSLDNSCSLLASIEKVSLRLKLMTWLRAGGPLPGAERIRPHEFKMSSASLQVLELSTKRLASVNHNSELIVRDVSTGEEIMKELLNKAGHVIAVAPLQESSLFASMTSNQQVFYGDTKAQWQVKANESSLVCVAGPEVVSVRDDGCLVMWNPNSGAVRVLLKDLPHPLVVLSKNPNGSGILFVAGYRSQKCGVISKKNSDWTVTLLPELTLPIIAGALDWKIDRVALALTDASVVIINIAGNKTYKKWKYNQFRDGQMRGRGKGVAFGSGPTSGKIFVALDTGQVASWDIEIEETTSFGTYKKRREADIFKCMEIWPESGLPFIVTEDYAQTLTPEGHSDINDDVVSAICMTDSGLIAAARYAANSISFYNPPNLKRATHTTHVPKPLMVSSQDESDSILVACKNGLVLQLNPPNYKYENDGSLMQSSAIGVCKSTQSGMSYWIAESNGDISCMPESSIDMNERKSRAMVQWTGTGFQRRLKVLPAGNEGAFWCMTTYEEGHGEKFVVELIDRPQTSKKLFEGKGWKDIAVSSVRNLVAAVGPSIVVYDCHTEDWNVVFSSKDMGDLVVFCSEEKWLIIASGYWLKVHKMVQDLPVVAAQIMSGVITSLSSRGNMVAVGLQSGDIAFFTVESVQ